MHWTLSMPPNWWPLFNRGEQRILCSPTSLFSSIRVDNFSKKFGTLAHDAMPQWYSLHSPKCIWGSSDLNCEVFARASVRCWRYRNLKLIISWKYTKRSLFSVSFFPMHFWNCSKTTQNWTISALITRGVMGKISEKKLLFQAPSYHYFTDS